MKIALAAIVLTIILVPAAYAQNCIESARVVAPQMSGEGRKTQEAKLAEARNTLTKNPNDPDAMIWVGRRLGYLGAYKEAIRVFSEGAARFPKDARFLRHRGHRYITLRCFDDAIRDFEAAAKLVKGQPDEIEPDGLPNAMNIPTSTLQSNI
jgi:tetratricopeptide (TPR) repeat protein